MAAEHKFKIGQLVYFHPKTPEGPYKVLKRLPAANGEYQYVIRSTDGSHERVVRESELSPAAGGGMAGTGSKRRAEALRRRRTVAQTAARSHCVT